MTQTCNLHFSKFTECISPRMNPAVNYRLRVIMMYLRRLLTATNLVQDLVVREAVLVWDTECIEALFISCPILL